MVGAKLRQDDEPSKGWLGGVNYTEHVRSHTNTHTQAEVVASCLYATVSRESRLPPPESDVTAIQSSRRTIRFFYHKVDAFFVRLTQ